MTTRANPARGMLKKYIFCSALALSLLSGLVLAPHVYAAAVSVVDSGVNPNYADLAGRILPGVDFVDGDNDPFDESSLQHGTIVSRIIASVHGENRILPIRVLDAALSGSVANFVNGIDFASSSTPRIINLSLGADINVYNAAVANSINNATSANKLVVIAAGNNGFTQPTFPASLAAISGGGVIAVGALNPDRTLAPYSNQAGPSKEYYIAAPGYSSFSPAVGTSFATPYVSGTAAAILSQNPNLSASQVSEIILATADDLGEPGTDDVYGRGGLNTAAALSPQGDISVAGSDDSSGSGALLGGVLVGAAVAAALVYKNKSMKKAVVVDSYNRPYQVDLDELSVIRDDTLSLRQMMDNLQRTTEAAQLPLARDLHMTAWYDLEPDWSFNQLNGFETENNVPSNWSLSLQQGGQTGGYRALNLNMDPRIVFGFAEDAAGAGVFAQRNLTAPYAGFSTSANMFLSGYRATSGAEFKAALIDMREADDYGLESQSLLIEGSYKPHEKLRLGLQLSGLEEQGSLFGGASTGALSVEQAGTVAAGLSARWQLDSRLLLYSIYSRGYTLVSENTGGLFKKFSGIQSDTYALGLQGREIFSEKDYLSVTLSSPLHIKSGSLTLDVPTRYDVYSGTAYREQEVVDLADSQRETHLELGYHLPVARKAQFAAYMLYRDMPSVISDKTRQGRYGMMMSLSTRF